MDPTNSSPSISAKTSKKSLDINGGAGINAWVESMRASSPRRTKTTCTPLLQEYNTWIRRHPSALCRFDEITSAVRGKEIVMFLDYDGTLSPIVDDPDRAFMSVEMRKTVRNLAKFFPTAIVSGRCRDKVYKFVKLPELYYAGSHGMDMKGPATGATWKKDVVCQPARDFLSLIEDVYRTLVERTKATPGSSVENNKFCVSVHFRCVDENDWNGLAGTVLSVVKEYTDLYVAQGRKVLEIRPSVKWDKGKAIELLLDSLSYPNASDVFPIYIGDDITDEDAFKAIRDRGQGFGILATKFPKDTNAFYSLREPNEVMEFLQRLVEWKSRG